ncbi:MAG: hypothetical protein IBJ15_00130 [Alphaproteobacteria bacterium]|nr:hypothetical protein [Alphaproteobacteria bacterium]
MTTRAPIYAPDLGRFVREAETTLEQAVMRLGTATAARACALVRELAADIAAARAHAASGERS